MFGSMRDIKMQRALHTLHMLFKTALAVCKHVCLQYYAMQLCALLHYAQYYVLHCALHYYFVTIALLHFLLSIAQLVVLLLARCLYSTCFAHCYICNTNTNYCFAYAAQYCNNLYAQNSCFAQ